MSKEAMKLALEALERTLEMLEQADCSTGYCCCGSLMDRHGIGDGHGPVDGGDYYQSKVIQAARQAITALREALAEQPAQQDSTCSNALREQGKAYPRTCKKCGLGPCVELAQQALDKKAENARELGLDYEPVWGGGPTNKDYEDAMRAKGLLKMTAALEQPAQTATYTCSVCGVPMHMEKPAPAQQKPVAFLDWYDNAHWGNEDFKDGCWRAWDAALAQRTWVGLTDEEQEIASWTDGSFGAGARWADAKLKEKNT